MSTEMWLLLGVASVVAVLMALRSRLAKAEPRPLAASTKPLTELETLLETAERDENAELAVLGALADSQLGVLVRQAHSHADPDQVADGFSAVFVVVEDQGQLEFQGKPVIVAFTSPERVAAFLKRDENRGKGANCVILSGRKIAEFCVRRNICLSLNVGVGAGASYDPDTLRRLLSAQGPLPGPT